MRIKFLDMDECLRVAFSMMLVVGIFCMGLPFGVWWLGCLLFKWLDWNAFYNVFHLVGFVIAFFCAFGLTCGAKNSGVSASYGALILDAAIVAMCLVIFRGEFWTLWMITALVGLAIHLVGRTPAVAKLRAEQDSKAEDEGLESTAQALIEQGADPAEVQKAVEIIRAEKGTGGQVAWFRLVKAMELQMAEINRRKEAEKAAREKALAAKKEAARKAEAHGLSETEASFQPDSAIAREILRQMKPIPGKDWRMARTPVTQKQWKALMGGNPSQNQDDDNPVENVTYAECLRFIKRLNGQSAVKRAGVTFRLPDSDDWEWVFRGYEEEYLERNVVERDQVELHRIPLVGKTYANEFAFRLIHFKANDEQILERMAWWRDNSYQTNPVGQKKPNYIGLYDLLGNVFERTSTEGDSGRVCRGGSFNSGFLGDGFEEWEGFEERKEFNDDERSLELGFRLCADGYKFEPLPDPIPVEYEESSQSLEGDDF